MNRAFIFGMSGVSWRLVLRPPQCASAYLLPRGDSAIDTLDIQRQSDVKIDV